MFSKVGRNRPFPDTYPLVADTVRRLGWTTLCNSDNPEASRAHFLRLYKAALDRKRSSRLDSVGLELPEDQDDLAVRTGIVTTTKGAPQVVQPSSNPAVLPSSEDGTLLLKGASQIRHEHHLTELPPPGPEEAKEPPAFREPTEEELQAAAKRRATLHTQLEKFDEASPVDPGEKRDER